MAKSAVLIHPAVMFFYYAFPAFVAIFSLLLARFCHWKGGMFLVLWFVLSIALGIGGLFIPWHSSSGFHYGSGSPVPAVVFERSGDHYLDFPVPAAALVNPVFVFLIGGFCWITAVIIRRLLNLKSPSKSELANP